VRLVDEQPIFYYDLGSPYAYLAAERVNGLFAEACGQPPEWQPILLGGLFKRFGRESWANGPGRREGMREVERRASARGLSPLRWPEPFPGNTLLAMRAATYAKEIGRTVSFSLAAFRQAFAAGRDLSDPDNMALAAAAAEIHPRAVLAAVKRDQVKRALREATDRAGDLGVRGVPSVLVAGAVFWGDDRLEEAAQFSAGRPAR
ncbi:MAG TPA: DsbA family protein, partial [Solirubrobacterales bacterium]|nr:DsbA family protein [Solirubrobacterales bacterium]